MRDYQREKNNSWHLPKQLYKQTLCLIRDYPRLKEEYKDVIEGRHFQEGGGKSSKPGDPTGTLACRIESIHDRIVAVEKALTDIPEEYRNGIWKNIAYDTRFPDDADRTTYGRWKARYVWQVAYNMHWI